MISLFFFPFLLKCYSRKLGYSVTEVSHHSITLDRAFTQCPWECPVDHTTVTATLGLTLRLLSCRFPSGSQLLAETSE